MTDLVERLEGAAAGSRELDAEVARLFGGQVVKRYNDFDWRESGTGLWQKLPPVTTSIDAVVALAERVLPGCVADLSIYPDGLSVGSVDFGQRLYACKAATPALALCAAVVRAHAEQVQG